MSDEPTAPMRIRIPTGAEMDAAFEPYVAAVGKVSYVWNYLHEQLAKIFAVVMHPCASEVSLAVWYSIKNDFAQRQMLAAALNASPKNRWGSDRTAAYDDLDWLLKQMAALWDDRDNAVHAPCSAYSGDDGTEMRAAYENGHPRAAKLAGKKLIDEFAYCERRGQGIGGFCN